MVACLRLGSGDTEATSCQFDTAAYLAQPCLNPSETGLDKSVLCICRYHFDLSNQAFGMIANINDGVVGVYYRQVGCSERRDPFSE